MLMRKLEEVAPTHGLTTLVRNPKVAGDDCVSTICTDAQYRQRHRRGICVSKAWIYKVSQCRRRWRDIDELKQLGEIPEYGIDPVTRKLTGRTWFWKHLPGFVLSNQLFSADKILIDMAMCIEISSSPYSNAICTIAAGF